MKTVIIPANTNKYPFSVTRSALAAMKQINNDISEHIVIKELARLAGTNECTLKKGFKDIFKITVYQHLLKSRMKYANLLLRTTNRREMDIAVLCGYKSLPGFISTYRKHFRINPGEYRRQLK